jgi:serine/threonine protein kinase
MKTLVPDHVDSNVSGNKQCIDLISSLLKRNPAKRLGTKFNDTLSILGHDFFIGVDLASLGEKKYKPKVPYVPERHTKSTVFGSFQQQKLMGLPKLEQNFGGNDALFAKF